MARLALVLAALAITAVITACAADAQDDSTGSANQDLSAKASDEWFYGGPLPALDNPHVVASLNGHTTHVSGTLPAGVTIPDLPHVKTSQVNGKTQVDVVYPIASAAKPSDNSNTGTYHFQGVKPYRPNGNAYTESAGNHFVTWAASRSLPTTAASPSTARSPPRSARSPTRASGTSAAARSRAAATG